MRIIVPELQAEVKEGEGCQSLEDGDRDYSDVVFLQHQVFKVSQAGQLVRKTGQLISGDVQFLQDKRPEKSCPTE